MRIILMMLWRVMIDLKEIIKGIKDLKQIIDCQSVQIKKLADLVRVQEKVILRQQDFIKSNENKK